MRAPALALLASLAGCAWTVGGGARALPMAGAALVEGQVTAGMGFGAATAESFNFAYDMAGSFSYGKDLRGEGTTASQLVGFVLSWPGADGGVGWRASAMAGAREHMGEGPTTTSGEAWFELGALFVISHQRRDKGATATGVSVNGMVGGDFGGEGPGGLIVGLSVTLEYHSVDDFKLDMRFNQ